MLRRLSETFTATHFTILAVTAILAPSALYATVATTAVSITDPVTGTKSSIDGMRRLSVYDPVAYMQNNPQNFARILLSCANGGSIGSYNPPSGKALIIKSIDFSYYNGMSGSDNYMYIHVNGSGKIAGIENSNIAESRTAELGNGYYVRNGEQISSICASNGAYIAGLTGYLVPSTQVPTSDAAAQSARVGPAIMKNGRQM